MLPCESLPVAAAGQPTVGEFPYYVEPAADEALLSWLLRLATRMEVSLHTLAEQCFGVDDAPGHSQWWCRPHPWVLKRISQRTGVSVARLRRMTFTTFAPVYDDDEVNERFKGQRYYEPQPDQHAYRFAVCGLCLEADTIPYLRRPWLIGWMAVCPTHDCILTVRCSDCHTKCHVAHFAHVANFSPTVCTRCGQDLLDDYYLPASPAVITLQAALLEGKCEGVSELGGFGVLTWKEIVALTDVLLGMFWISGMADERWNDITRFYRSVEDEPADELGAYDGRYMSLRLLAWLTEDWPNTEGSQLGEQLLANCLRCDDGPAIFEPAIRERLAALLT